MQQLVPYGGIESITTYPRTQQAETPGQNNGVYITLHPEHRQMLVEKIISWFAGRDEIDFVETGLSDKVGLGYIILEWIECAIDPLFLAILRDEEVVVDYTVYAHELED